MAVRVATSPLAAAATPRTVPSLRQQVIGARPPLRLQHVWVRHRPTQAVRCVRVFRVAPLPACARETCHRADRVLLTVRQTDARTGARTDARTDARTIQGGHFPGLRRVPSSGARPGRAAQLGFIRRGAWLGLAQPRPASRQRTFLTRCTVQRCAQVDLGWSSSQLCETRHCHQY